MSNLAPHIQPEWFSPPGATMLSLMKRKDVSFDALSEHMSVSGEDTEALLAGKQVIDLPIAEKLSTLLGGSCEFWLTRQAHFESDLKRCVEVASGDRSAQFLAELPVNEMKKMGWLRQTVENLEAVFQFFDVQSLDHWETKYRAKASAVAFRQSYAFPANAGSTIAWLREAEKQASSIKCEPWDKSKFRSSLAKLRHLTRKRTPQTFMREIRKVCAATGVAVVCVPTPNGCRASGATQFVSKNKAMIIMSFRFRSDDHFWFTFFHEAAHLILHDERALFVEDDSEVTSEEEREANEFSRNLLLPDEMYSNLLDLRVTTKNIIRFAVKCGVCPGIIVGQLQHAGLIGRNQYNGLKRHYAVADLEAVY